MSSERPLRRAWEWTWPYIPLVALVMVYLVAGFGQALAVIREPRYALLGLITFPLFIALVISALRIRREQRSK
jgi:ABC-type transport system involved in cytochrome c biogenesis permease component